MPAIDSRTDKSTPHTDTPTPWPTIILLAMTAFCAAATQRILDPMLPRLAEVYTTTLSAASWAITAFAIVYGCLQLVLGPSGDRYGKLRVISLFSCSLPSPACCAFSRAAWRH
ncbi:hypothetical protein NYA28ABAC_03686 [Salinicola sp. NYA28a]|nr:MFS transporter [Salinicola salarius]MED5500547.1 MFS transporter [Pseudomonadota bacterium]